MTTLTLVQNAGIAIDQAITLIISENRIDEAVEKLNEAKVCTMKMEQMINPPEPEPKPEEKRTLRKEVCDARTSIDRIEGAGIRQPRFRSLLREDVCRSRRRSHQDRTPVQRR